MSVCIHIFMLCLGQRALKRGGKVENIELNALVSWEVSFTVFHLRLECVLLMSGLTPNAVSYVGFWVAKMKAFKSSVSFPAPCSAFRTIRTNQKIGNIKLGFFFRLCLCSCLFVGGQLGLCKRCTVIFSGGFTRQFLACCLIQNNLLSLIIAVM